MTTFTPIVVEWQPPFCWSTVHTILLANGCYIDWCLFCLCQSCVMMRLSERVIDSTNCSTLLWPDYDRSEWSHVLALVSCLSMMVPCSVCVCFTLLPFKTALIVTLANTELIMSPSHFSYIANSFDNSRWLHNLTSKSCCLQSALMILQDEDPCLGLILGPEMIEIDLLFM